MDITTMIALLGPWIEHVFPSLAEYIKYVGPAIMGASIVIGIFTNILPEPGHKYPVPDVTELQAELEGGGGFILKIAKFARNLTVSANWFIATAGYSWFYNSTNKMSSVLSKFKKSSSSDSASKPTDTIK